MNEITQYIEKRLEDAEWLLEEMRKKEERDEEHPIQAAYRIAYFHGQVRVLESVRKKIREMEGE